MELDGVSFSRIYSGTICGYDNNIDILYVSDVDVQYSDIHVRVKAKVKSSHKIMRILYGLDSHEKYDSYFYPVIFETVIG